MLLHSSRGTLDITVYGMSQQSVCARKTNRLEGGSVYPPDAPASRSGVSF